MASVDRFSSWRLIWLSLVFLMVQAGLWAERFQFSHVTGDKYRIISTVNEDVLVDRQLSHRAEILNRITVEVTAAEAGTGTLAASFQTSEKSLATSGAVFQWAREYQSIFKRDPFGRYTIEDNYWMPVVRDVPLFPDRDLLVGDSWSAEGEEVHDFRDVFGIPEPYRIPFIANYRYLGDKERDGNLYAVFSVSYRIFEEPAMPARASTIWPTRIMGASDQTLYWDRALGQAAAYNEIFRMVFELSNGYSLEYRGSAAAEVVEAAPMDRGQLADEIAEEIVRLGIADTAVRVTDEGVAISLENIGFQADSAVLLASEQTKLDGIAVILARYPERDVLISGHTALAGTAAGRQLLSEERAAAVAAYLITNGVRTAERVVVRGYGAEQPLADNTTEEGMRRNRRVEITILEN